MELTVNLRNPSSKIIKRTITGNVSDDQSTSIFDTLNKKSLKSKDEATLPNRFKSLLGQSTFFNSKDFETSKNLEKEESKNKKFFKQNSKETIVFEDINNSSLYNLNLKNTIYNSKEATPIDHSFKSITLIDKKEQIYNFSIDNAKTIKNNSCNRFLTEQKKTEKYKKSTPLLNKSSNTVAPEIKDFYVDIKFTKTSYVQSQPKIKRGNVNLVYDLQHKINDHLKTSLDQQYLSMYTLPNHRTDEDFESDDISEDKPGPKENQIKTKKESKYNFDIGMLNEKDELVSVKDSFILSGSTVTFLIVYILKDYRKNMKKISKKCTQLFQIITIIIIAT